MEPTQEELLEVMVERYVAEAMPVLLDADEYADKLDKIAHVKFHNLAICYMFELGKKDDLTINGYVKPEYLEMIGETKESFFDKMIKKAMIKRPAMINTLRQEVEEILQDNGMQEDVIVDLPDLPESKNILVIKNGYQFGAITLFYPGVMEAVADLMGGSYFIIPSSRHEMMAAPVDGNTPEVMRRMVRDINETEVEEQDKLTDEIYFYDADKNKFLWLVEDLEQLKN